MDAVGGRLTEGVALSWRLQGDGHGLCSFELVRRLRLADMSKHSYKLEKITKH